MTHSKLYYRVQPRGLPLLGHDSDDWSGSRMVGRVCAYESHQALLAGEGDDWTRQRGLEVVTFRGRCAQQLGGAHVPGVSVKPGEVIRRTALAKFLKEIVP